MYEEYEHSHIKLPDGFVLDEPIRLSDIPETKSESTRKPRLVLDEPEWKPSSAVPIEAPVATAHEKSATFDPDAYLKAELELKGSFSTRALVGLCVLAGFGGGIAGFVGTWFVYYIIWLIYRFIKWLVLGFYDNDHLQPEKT